MKANPNDKFYLVGNLREIRKEKYQNRETFADDAKVSIQTAARAEQGKLRLAFDSIVAMARVLGLKPEDIIDQKRSDEENKLDKLTVTKNVKKITPYDKLGIKNYGYISHVEEIVKVKYMGRSAPIDLEDGDKLNTLFFTKDLDKTLDESEIHISIPMKERDFLKIVDKLYEQYKDKPLDLHGIDRSCISKEELKILERKIVSLRLGEEVTLKIIDYKHIDIIDFYPKAKISHLDEIYSLVESFICKIDRSEKIKLSDAIIASGFEKIDKIIRCSLISTKEISQYVKDNIEEFILLRESFAEMTYVLIKYFEKNISAKEAQESINKIYKYIKIRAYLLSKLDELYGFNRAMCMYNKSNKII